MRRCRPTFTLLQAGYNNSGGADAERAYCDCLWQRIGDSDDGDIDECNRKYYIFGHQRRNAAYAGHGGAELRLGELQYLYAGCRRAQSERDLSRRCDTCSRAVLRVGDDGVAAGDYGRGEFRIGALWTEHSSNERHADGRAGAG